MSSNLHKKIIAVRKKYGLSQPETAELANIPLRTYQRLESGETSASIDYLERIAAAHKCSVDYLLYFDLQTNQFEPPGPAENTALAQKNDLLEAENGHLRQFVNHLLDLLRGGGGQIAQNKKIDLSMPVLPWVALAYLLIAILPFYLPSPPVVGLRCMASELKGNPVQNRGSTRCCKFHARCVGHTRRA